MEITLNLQNNMCVSQCHNYSLNSITSSIILGWIFPSYFYVIKNIFFSRKTVLVQHILFGITTSNKLYVGIDNNSFQPPEVGLCTSEVGPLACKQL